MIACLYDVHGNLPALEAVLADADVDVDGYILGGDYALFGGWPAETVARLRELEPATWIRGNADRWLGDPPEELRQAVDHARTALGDTADELAALPETAEHGELLICHGSPASDMRSFYPEPAEDEPELLAGVTASRLMFGHTHLQFRRMAGGIELINPGSVGAPLDGDHRAAYAVIHDDGRLEHRRVAYDHSASVAKLRSLGDWAEIMALRIERAEV